MGLMLSYSNPQQTNKTNLKMHVVDGTAERYNN